MSDDTQQQAMADITWAVMHLLDKWQLDNSTMQQILAMPETVKPRNFAAFRNGKAVFPNHPEVLRRSHYLLRIADALRTAYPMNPKMIARWIHQGQRRFGGRTPISMILTDGEAGLVSVLSELDCSFAWDCSGSKAVSAAK
ncbi:MbcA/ParS/Xre antitoxin family protein [Thiolapillus sp.]